MKCFASREMLWEEKTAAARPEQGEERNTQEQGPLSSAQEEYVQERSATSHVPQDPGGFSKMPKAQAAADSAAKRALVSGGNSQHEVNNGPNKGGIRRRQAARDSLDMSDSDNGDQAQSNGHSLTDIDVFA